MKPDLLVEDYDPPLTEEELAIIAEWETKPEGILWLRCKFYENGPFIDLGL